MELNMQNMQKYQPKLVRDKIPSLMAKEGKTVVIAKLSDDDYYQALRCKLQEEVQEFLNDQNIEELADVLEVVLSIASLKFGGINELELKRKCKEAAKGSFDERFVILSVGDGPITIV